MDLNGFHVLVQRLASRGEMPAFLTGVVATVVVGGLVVKFAVLPWLMSELRRSRDRQQQQEQELQAARDRDEVARRECDVRQAEIGALRHRNAELQAALGDRKAQVTAAQKAVEGERRGRIEEAHALQKQLLEAQARLAEREKALRAAEARLAGEQREAHELAARCQWLESDLECTRSRLQVERQGREVAETALDELVRKQRNLLNADFRVWERPVQDVPAFVSLGERQAPIVAVMNLKGGVGKTNITANLGVALGRLRRPGGEEPRKVLVVDLDFQGSLTDLCLSYEQREEVRRTRRLGRRLLADGIGDPSAVLEECVTAVQAVPEGRLHLVAADEQLEAVENRLMLRWSAGQIQDDVRFRLRETLQRAAGLGGYDLVLLDCPPRLTTGCINALTSSDWLLIPVLLDEVSARAVPRMLRWVQKLRPELCPDLELLGVVANRVSMYGGKPIKREAEVWARLQPLCERYWGAPVRHFEAMIGQHTEIPYAGGVRLAALDRKHESRYLDLASAVIAEIYVDARG